MLKGKDAKVKPEPAERSVKLNRNFMNYPLARDLRTKTLWYPRGKTGRWFAELPGDNRITLIMPSDVSKKRHKQRAHAPTALDMNLLYQILAELQLCRRHHPDIREARHNAHRSPARHGQLTNAAHWRSVRWRGRPGH